MKIIKDIPVIGSESRLMGTDIFINENTHNAPIVIYIHGFNGLKDWANFDLIATQFAEAGFCFVKMNMSHNGTTLESPLDFADLEAFGNNNYTKELFDIGCILDWVVSPENPFLVNVDSKNISVIGHSRGGGIAILKSAEDARIKKLITWASISECKTPWGTMSTSKLEKWKDEGVMYYSNKRTNQSMPLYFQLFEDYQINQDLLNIEKAIKKLNIPILICHGTLDPAVPYSSALQLHKWQPKSEFFSVESDHVFGRSHPWNEPNLPQAMQAVVNRTIQFLKVID